MFGTIRILRTAVILKGGTPFPLFSVPVMHKQKYLLERNSAPGEESGGIGWSMGNAQGWAHNFFSTMGKRNTVRVKNPEFFPAAAQDP